MEDRFKFRIPQIKDDSTFKRFHYLELGDFIPAVLGGGYNGDPQQCTGLKDKNGKLIYEGDIIKTKFFGKTDNNGHNFNDFEIFDVVWYKGSYQFNNQKRPYYPLRFCYEYPDKFEIIGNIYENPELLES